MAETCLGVSAHHEELAASFLRFSRFRRAQCVKAVDAAFKDLAESRLVEETFTAEEVREMLSGLSSLVVADVESELINTVHTSVVLLRQLFKRAEQYHLSLHAEISELEDGELLETVAKFEHLSLDAASSPSLAPSLKAGQLEPLASVAGGESLLQLEIKRMEEEKKELSQRLRDLEAKASMALGERDQLKAELAQVTELGHGLQAATEREREEVEELRKKLSLLQEQLETRSSPSPPSDGDAVKEELVQTAHELLRVQAELRDTKKELEKKFNETAQYHNLRTMLSSKNDLIRQLRAHQSPAPGNQS